MNKEILSKLKDISLFIFDLEGVLLNEHTPNELAFSKLISDVKKASIEFEKRKLHFAIITARSRDDLILELEKIPNCIVISSTIDKVSSAEKILKDLNLSCQNVFFIGDGILDIPLLKKCGLSAAPKTTKREVKREADLIINSSNSEGVFNEVFQLLNKVKNLSSKN